MKNHPELFKAMKTKPITRVCVSTADIEEVKNWFQGFHTWCEENNIKAGDVLNFDEAGFWVGVTPGEEIIVPAYVMKLYTATAKNRKSITMIETIIANGTVIPPLMIIQGKQHMKNWYSTNLEKDVRVVLSDSGYINKEISLTLLDHIALHTNAGLDKYPKVLLMDQHGSHMDPDFIIKATSYNIHPYPFPGHLTHILQPLDVGVFQPYKHWHEKAIQHAMRNLNLDYNVASFMRDLHKIQTETLKKGTIQTAFRKAGIWPISCKTAIEKIKIYAPPKPQPDLPTLP
jgi:hypothetical protein